MAVLKASPSRGASVRRCLVAALLFASASRRAHAQTADSCLPPPAVKTALDALPSQAPADTDWDFHEKYLAALQTLLRQFPDDFFVHRRYVAFMISHAPSDSEKVIGATR